MKNMTKKLVSIILMLTLVLSLVACGGTEPDSEDSANAPQKKAEITIAIEATGDIPEAFQAQIDRFNASSETAEVSILTYAGAEAYETAITGQIAGQSAPDIIWLDGGKKIQEYVENGVIVSLDEYLGDIVGSFEQSLLEAFMVDGKVYGVPKDYNTSVLFYQKDLFDAAGIQVPETMDAFIDATEQLTDGEIYGFGTDPKLNYLYPFMATYGADFIGADGTINVDKLDSDEHRAALKVFKDLYDQGFGTTPYLANAGWDGELVGNGKVAMLYGGSWITGVIQDIAQTGVAPLPTINDGYSMLYTAGWAVTEQSPNKEAAAELISFMSSDEEMVEGNKVGLIGLPPTESAMKKLIEEKSDDPFLPVYNEVVKGGVAFGLIDSQFVDAYNKAFENMLYNNGSVDETVEAMVNAVK